MPEPAHLYDYWWHPLLAIPPSPTSPEYERLRRLWWDPTRVRKVAGTKLPEFYHRAWETHLTAVLWENFAFLPMRNWTSSLKVHTSLKHLPGEVHELRWSYGWVAKVDTKRGIRIVDVVLNYRDKTGAEGVLVVEAKRPKEGIGDGKDLDPAYYLDIPRLRDFGDRRSMLYLVGERRLEETRARVEPGHWDVGFISWEDLGSLQIAAVLSATELPEQTRCVVAAAIHRQFVEYGIRPSRTPIEYLASERSWREIQKHQEQVKQKFDGQREFWCLPKK